MSPSPDRRDDDRFWPPAMDEPDHTGVAQPHPATVPDAAAIAGIRQRSAAGVAAVAFRGAGVRLLGLATSVLLARLLLPQAFGVLAFGFTIVSLASFAANAGLAAGLVRRPESPTRRVLSSALGFQLLASASLLACVVLAALAVGEAGRVAALMAVSLLFAAFKAPALVQLERELRFKPVAAAEVVEAIAFSVAAVVLVTLGAGVWGVAVAAAARPVVGAALLQRQAAARVVWPAFDWSCIRPVLAFGLALQGAQLAAVIRDQGVNIATAALAGVSTLGYWSVAQRLMLVPFIVFEALWRVSYPAIARLVDAGHDVRRDIGRALHVGTLLTGAFVVPLSASAPILVPLLFGEAWTPVVPVVPLASIGLLVAGPVSTVASGYFSAIGRASFIARVQVATIVPWAVLLPVLLPQVGVTAHGVAWSVAALVEALLFGSVLHKMLKVKVFTLLLPSAGCSVLAGGAGLWLAASLPTTLLALVACAALSTSLFVVLNIVVAREACRDVIRLARLMLRR